MENQKLITAEERATIEETGEVTIGSRTIIFGSDDLTLVEMFEKAEADGCTNSDGSCTNAEHLHIGDYVNYNPGTSGSYPSEVSQTGHKEAQVFKVDNTTTWRVLGTEGTGNNKHIIITSGSPIKKETTKNDPYYYLYGAKGYINMKTELDNICAIYGKGTGATGARSMKMEDVNNVTGVTVSSTGVKPDGVDQLRNMYGEGIGTFGQTISYTNQYASPEDYLAGKKSDFSKTLDSYFYEGNDAKLKTATNKRAYNLLFKDTDQPGNKYYWVASSFVCGNSEGILFCGGNIIFGFGGNFADNYLFGADGREARSGLAVRPVVSLKSDVSTETIQKIADQQEEDWSKYTNMY